MKGLNAVDLKALKTLDLKAPNTQDLKGRGFSRAAIAGTASAALAAENPVQSWLAAAQADVLFEATSLNVQTGQPAIDHIRAALIHEVHAITANKGPIVHAYRELRLDEIAREGIRNLSAEAVRAAKKEGKPYKLVCRAKKAGSQVTATVRPDQLPQTGPMAKITGSSNYIYFTTDIFPGLALTEENPGLYATAYGLLADFVRAVS